MHLHLTVYTTQFHIESTSSLEVHHQPHDSPSAWTVQCSIFTRPIRLPSLHITQWGAARILCASHGRICPATDLSVMGLFMCPSRRGRVFWHMAMGGGIIAYRRLAKTMKLPWTGVLAWYIRCCCTNGKTCTLGPWLMNTDLHIDPKTCHILLHYFVLHCTAGKNRSTTVGFNLNW